MSEIFLYYIKNISNLVYNKNISNITEIKFLVLLMLMTNSPIFIYCYDLENIHIQYHTMKEIFAYKINATIGDIMKTL